MAALAYEPMTLEEYIEWEKFLASNEQAQRRHIESLSRQHTSDLAILYGKELQRLRDLNEEIPDWQFLLWSDMLAKGDPDDYQYIYKDPDKEDQVRKAMTPAALAKLRADTDEARVRPLILATTAKQTSAVKALAPIDRFELLKSLDRYARQWGRSQRVRDLEDLVRKFLQ